MKRKLPENFILIEAEKLSLSDEFMQYETKTENEINTKKHIIEAIEIGVKNFYRPKYDPSRGQEGRLQFVSGQFPYVTNPAHPIYECNGLFAWEHYIGRPYNWWYNKAEKYYPERNSRLGTKHEYFAFIGVLIKKLIEEGKTAEWAWNAVCNDSRELGHYVNSENARITNFEFTGSRCVCGFYDLANTKKILADNTNNEWLDIAGGTFSRYSDDFPLASIRHCTGRDHDIYDGVGWLVLS